jgi:hypothetical protein
VVNSRAALSLADKGSWKCQLGIRERRVAVSAFSGFLSSPWTSAKAAAAMAAIAHAQLIS